MEENLPMLLASILSVFTRVWRLLAAVGRFLQGHRPPAKSPTIPRGSKRPDVTEDVDTVPSLADLNGRRSLDQLLVRIAAHAQLTGDSDLEYPVDIRLATHERRLWRTGVTSRETTATESG